MKHLITVEEVRKYGRPISKQVDNEKLESYIYETERLSIKPVLGDELFSRLLSIIDIPNEDVYNKDLVLLLEGGEYTDRNDGFHMFSGLKMAMSYYIYAQYVMDGDFQLTRSGVVVKDSAYSSHVSSKERSDCYNNALAAAKGFMDEVKYFMRERLPQYFNSGKMNPSSPHNSIIIKKIG